MLEDLPIVVVLVNNGYLGMVTQWQDMFFDGRRSHVDLDAARCRTTSSSPRPTAASGCSSSPRTSSSRRSREALALGRTVVIDCRVDPAEQCFPMIPAGAAALDMVEYEEHGRGGAREAHALACWSRTSPARSRGSRRCSRAAASTSTRSRSARPSAPASRASRSASTASSTRSSRSRSRSTSSSTCSA